MPVKIGYPLSAASPRKNIFQIEPHGHPTGAIVMVEVGQVTSCYCVILCDPDPVGMNNEEL